MKKPRLSPEELAECSALKVLWAERHTMSQKDFGEKFGLGNQSNVAHYLNGRNALSLEAAGSFARHLDVGILEFSPRLARLAARLSTATGPEMNERRASYSGKSATTPLTRSDTNVFNFAPTIDVGRLGAVDLSQSNKGEGFNALAIPGQFTPQSRLGYFPDDSMEPEVFKGDPIVLEIGGAPWNNDIVLYRPKGEDGSSTVLPGRCIFSRIGKSFVIRTNKPDIYPDVDGDQVDVIAVVLHRLLGRTGRSPARSAA